MITPCNLSIYKATNPFCIYKKRVSIHQAMAPATLQANKQQCAVVSRRLFHDILKLPRHAEVARNS